MHHIEEMDALIEQLSRECQEDLESFYQRAYSVELSLPFDLQLDFIDALSRYEHRNKLREERKEIITKEPPYQEVLINDDMSDSLDIVNPEGLELFIIPDYEDLRDITYQGQFEDWAGKVPASSVKDALGILAIKIPLDYVDFIFLDYKELNEILEKRISEAIPDSEGLAHLNLDPEISPSDKYEASLVALDKISKSLHVEEDPKIILAMYKRTLDLWPHLGHGVLKPIAGASWVSMARTFRTMQKEFVHYENIDSFFFRNPLNPEWIRSSSPRDLEPGWILRPKNDQTPVTEE
jgi:hypothetical protein